jgi:hypothetical protein|tara:strand:+ start:1086 stop:1631 length:546 start_codon:yes stop_codon:yes gene_type:complete
MASAIVMLMASNNAALLNVVPSIKTLRYVGSTHPLPNFDPLNILDKKSENKIKFTREAELQHGRTSMAAIPSIAFLEQMDTDGSMLGINYLSSLDAYHQAPFWLGMASFELLRMGRGWVNPFTENKTFNLKQNYQPGNLGNYNMSTISDELLNKELNNGRLAMIAFMGILAQELVTGQNVF